MCQVISTTADLMEACFAKDLKRFTELYDILGRGNQVKTLIWSVQAGWETAVSYLSRTEGATLHPPGENLLCEAIRFNRASLVRYIIRRGEFYNERHFPDIIEAIHLAEKKCQHETALYLLNFLLDRTTEGLLEEKFGFKISESLKTYSRGREYINHTRHVREINYLQHISV